MSLRLNRLNEAIEHEVSRVLRTYFREDAVFITIVGVLISPDLKLAQVKFSVIGDDKACRCSIRFFSKHKHFIRQKLCNRLRIRSIPDLKFEITDAIARGNHLVDILSTLTET
jgi:ribosome-binding factor A